MSTPPIISKILVITTFSAFVSLAAAPANAATLIPGVTASFTGFQSFGSFDINQVVDGSGLPGNVPALTGTHAVASMQNSWSGAGTTGNINFNLNGLYELDGFRFWNYNSSDILRGINIVSILTSTDDVTYTPLPNVPTRLKFTIGANNSPQSPQQFAFTPISAAFVQFAVLSN